MFFLRKSTVSNILMGPFLDATDGVTPETGLTPTVRVSINGGGPTARNSAASITHSENGYYIVQLDDTDTNTAGRLRVMVTNAATHLPVWENFLVLPANIYDSWIPATDFQQVDATQAGGTTLATPTTAGIIRAELQTATDIGTAAANDIADAWLDRASAVDGYTPRQLMRLIGAALLGEISGAAGTTIVVRDAADTKTRITAIVDDSGNRTAVTLDAT